jgi:hypothetical protein
MEQAAIKIQRFWRKNKFMIAVNRRRQKKADNRAILIIQAAWRRKFLYELKIAEAEWARQEEIRLGG